MRAMKREDGQKEAPPPFSIASRTGCTRRVRRNNRDRNLLAGSGNQDGLNQGKMGVPKGQPLSHQGSPVRLPYPVPIEVSVREGMETERVAPSTKMSGLLASSDRRRRPAKGVMAMVRENVGVRAHLGWTSPSLPTSSPVLTRSISSTSAHSLVVVEMYRVLRFELTDVEERVATGSRGFSSGQAGGRECISSLALQGQQAVME